MRKKVICLSIIAGLFLSLALGVPKGDTQGNQNYKLNTNSDSILSNIGPVDPEPKVIIPVTI